MVKMEIRDELPENSVVFDNPSFDNSIIGYDSDGRVVYSFDDMVKELMDDEKMSELDAIEFIDYNTIGSLPNGGEFAPIVMYNLYI